MNVLKCKCTRDTKSISQSIQIYVKTPLRSGVQTKINSLPISGKHQWHFLKFLNATRYFWLETSSVEAIYQNAAFAQHMCANVIPKRLLIKLSGADAFDRNPFTLTASQVENWHLSLH